MLRATTRGFRIAPLALAVAAVASACYGGDYDADLALRLPAALSRFAGYADVAAVGNSSAASKWATSVNPASSAWLPATGKFKLTLTPQFSTIAFDEGTRLYVTSEALTWETPGWGTILPAAAQVWSNEASTSLGPDFEFEAEVYQLEWGVRPDPKWALGLNINYTDSTVRFEQSGLELAYTHSQGIDVRAGVLHEITPKLRAGLVAEYGGTLNHNDMLAMMPTGLASLSAPSTTEQFIARPGISYEYAADSSFYADYQMVLLSDSLAGHLDLHRFSAGVDHQLFKGVFVRAGALVDTTGHFAWTCGAAITPAPWASIDLAFQHDFFPELTEELGHSDTFTLSISLSL